MTKQEFYDLLDKWTSSPEYREYEKLCFSCNSLSKQVEHEYEVIQAFNKAINNEYGKQLADEPMFLELLTKG